MRTFRLVGTVLMAVLMAVNFTACNDNEEIVEPNSPKMYTVSLGCIGEILDITESPLGRASGNDLYGIQVYTLKEISTGTGTGTGTTTYYREEPYAYGVFTSLDGLTIRLLEGNKYRFEAAMILNGGNNDFFPVGTAVYNTTGGKFVFTNGSINFSHSGNREYFYGRLEEYTPTKNGKTEIYMKRVSFGAKFIAEGLTEGTLNIKKFYSEISLTPQKTEDDNIYTFGNILSAYQATGEYSETREIKVSWTKADGTVHPLGTHSVTFKRNKKTTITIKVEAQTHQDNGIIITKEDAPPITDGEHYRIEGDSIITITVPIN